MTSGRSNVSVKRPQRSGAGMDGEAVESDTERLRGRIQNGPVWNHTSP
ncbi:hypothetical protein FEP41_03466 [Burkholderia multivorans]|nr:hypothetical protein [Burkholderia multivorans]MDR9105738.1 hypothetical protein [Burkholderia multivorans]MDR9108928.1 hypothetical protein [Burkholderia multivorans]